MSARVFNPLVLSEMRRMIGRSSSDATSPAVARVRRDLFGPVNHQDAQIFVDKELAALRERETARWGFDFNKESPTENSRFMWERVTSQNHDALRIPTKEASTNIQEAAHQPQPFEQNSRPCRQSHITEFLKCTRKRSMSMGDVSTTKKMKEAVSPKAQFAGSPKAPFSTGPPKPKRSRTRTRTTQ